MLKGKLIHPQILAALGRAGHGSKVLIADGNFPFSTKLGPKVELVSLNLAPGVVTCVQVLEALVSAIPIESAAVMTPAYGIPITTEAQPVIWKEFQKILGSSGFDKVFQYLTREQFYEAALGSDVALVIATGETEVYANLLLTIGVIKPE